MVRFDHDPGCWSWDLDGIHAKGYTDNVVDLMVGKLTRLPAETQKALQQLACLGDLAGTEMLAIVLGTSEEDVGAALWEAVRQALVERLDESYMFSHDRVQEAAYSMIPAEARAEAHLLIGRLLAAQTPPEKREEAIFEIVNQLNRGAALITQQEERDQLAEFNLIAGKRAKGSTAYASALAYLAAGAALLAEECWERRRELTFALELNRAECEFLTGALAKAEQRLAALPMRAATTVERATVACLRVDLYTTLGQGGRAIAVGLDYLRPLGIDWSPHPTVEEVRREYAQIWSQLGGRSIEDLVDLPLMSDPAWLATLDVLIRIVPPAVFTDANLPSLVFCRAVNLSLEHGNSDASCYAYTQLATVLGPHVGDYQTGFRFGQLGHELVERRGLRRFEAPTYLQRGYLTVWTRHVRAGRDLLRRGFDAANQIGDLTHAAYTCDRLNANMLAAGDPLVEVQREAEIGLGFAQKVRFDFAMELISPQLGLVRTLRGLTRKFGTFDDDQFDELGIERRFASNLDLQLAECWYWIRKLQARFFAGDHSSAIEASSRAQLLLWTSVSQFETAEYHYYGALSRAAAFDAASADERQQHLEALAAHHSQLKVWTENCPENFENRAALVGAEIARIEGRDVDAMRLYEQAIRSARDNGFVHNEAIAYERASDFYGARGFDQIADLYLRNARCGYVRWGADAKVRRLEETYPRLRREEPAAPSPTSTMAAPVERLDLATVIKVSQAVSSEMVLEKLIDTLMRTAIAQAGAERGLLILSREAEPRIEAEAAVSGDTVVVELRDAPVAASVLPETVLHFVLRVRESLILDDAGADASFAVDPYIRQHKARSIACLPLINQAKLVGVLYLENNLTARAFAPARIAVLKLLASQAAISLENSRLYRDLEQREAKIRGLVDANIIGIGLLGGDGRILEANDALLRLVGYDRQDLLSGRIRWMDLTPPEWWERSAQAATELAMTGAVRPFEKEYFHKDGSRVPVLVGLARIEGTGHQHVAFMLDLTERKRAEQALRRSEASLAEGQRLTRTGTWIYNPTKRETIYWSDEQFRIHGLSPQKDLPDTEVLERQLHPEDRRRVLARFAKAFRDKTDVEEDFRIVLNDGTIKHLHAVGHSVTDGTGELVEFIGTAVDVTERKRAEEALRRSEAYLAEAQRLSHTGSWARNANGETTHSSEEHSRLYGFDPELGVPSFEAFAERIHPEDRAKVTEIFRRAIGERTDFAMDFRTALPDGTLKYIHGVGHPVFDGAGELVEYIGTAVDVTERKRAEQALARNEKKLRDVIETIPAMAWTTLPDGSNDFANQSWVKLTGISSKASSGEGWKAWVHPADMATHIEKWRASLSSGEPFENEARIQRASDGEYRWFLHRAVPLRDESGNILKWYGISTEIDDRKRAEALLVGEKRILEMVAKGDSLAQILESLCRLVEEQASGVLASISLLDGDRLRQGGAPSLPKGYTDAIDGVLVGPSAGSCGTAAYCGEPMIVEDIATDPLWADSREAALSYSLRACWSTPIFSSQGKVIGTIAMYYREPRCPSPRDQETVEQITHLAGIAIERKMTQEALRRSEAHLAEAQRLTKTGSWAYDPLTGETTYWSDEMFRIFGLDPLEGPSSEKFWQHVHPEDHDRVRERVEREAHEKREYIDEYRIVLADGTVKDIQDIGHPVFDATGNLVEFVGSTVDVTERKRAEEALRESEERFRTLVQFSFDVYWESDAQHRFVRQEYAEGLADAPAAGCEIGKTRWEVPYLEPEAEAWRKHRERLDAHVPFRDFELARPTQDGGRRYVSVSGLPVFDKAGRFAGYRGVGRDITARKQGEAALRESEEQWKAVFENNPAMYFMVDAGGAIISVNPFGAEQLGFTVDELIGLPVQNLFHPEDREAVEKNTAICFQRHGPTMSWEWTDPWR